MDDLHLDDSEPPKLYLPKGWPSIATEAIFRIIAMARVAMIHAWNWSSDSNELNLRATGERFRTENSLLRREIAIKDERMWRIPPRRRPNYTSGERLEMGNLFEQIENFIDMSPSFLKQALSSRARAP
jgi:hypothetical protein